MHASTEQLLALRDGEPADAAIAAHVTACAACQAALTAQRDVRAALRALPPVPAPDGWDAVARRLKRHDAPARRPARGLLAVAAAGVLGLALAWWLAAAPGPRQHAVPVPVATTAAPSRDAPSTAAATGLTTLVARSAALERQLAALDARAPAVTRLGHVADTTRLRTRLRALESGHAQLGGPDETADLRELYWQERVRLLDSMVSIERAERAQRTAAWFQTMPTAY